MSITRFRFEDLRVYQSTLVFVSRVYAIIKIWPPLYKFSLADQFQRAALSIPLNIAEGSGRTTKDFQHFLAVARGLCYECIAILSVAKNEKLVSESEYLKVYEEVGILAKTLTALKSSVSHVPSK